MVQEIKDKKQKETISRIILENLEAWFGIEAYRENYIKENQALTFFAAFENNKPVGFIVAKETSPYALDIYCMGVLKDNHQKGHGKALIQALKNDAQSKGYKFLHVKTVEKGHYNEYDQTIDFYKKMGFYELEVFKTLWDEHNPCQVFIMSL